MYHFVNNFTIQDKKVTLKKFHGQVLLDIREFYMDKLSHEMMPGVVVGDLFLLKFLTFLFRKERHFSEPGTGQGVQIPV